MANFEELQKKHEVLRKELAEVGSRIGAMAGVMPFVKALPSQEADYKRYADIWDELGKLQRALFSN